MNIEKQQKNQLYLDQTKISTLKKKNVRKAEWLSKVRFKNVPRCGNLEMFFWHKPTLGVPGKVSVLSGMT